MHFRFIWNQWHFRLPENFCCASEEALAKFTVRRPKYEGLDKYKILTQTQEFYKCWLRYCRWKMKCFTLPQITLKNNSFLLWKLFSKFVGFVDFVMTHNSEVKDCLQILILISECQLVFGILLLRMLIQYRTIWIVLIETVVLPLQHFEI